MKIVDEARAAGLVISVEGDQLVIEGPRSAESLALALIARKHDVLAHLASENPEVAWRVEAMRAQVRGEGPLPALVARPHEHRRGRCLSCGAPVEPRWEGPSYRCGPCARAVQIIAREYAAALASRRRPRECGPVGSETGRIDPAVA